jgi:hypothetical protein
MSLIKKPLVALVIALMALPLAGFAQYQYDVKPFFSYLKDAKRYELSFNYIMPMGTFNGTSQVASGGTYLGDTTIQRAATGTGFGGSIGLTMPFKGTGHISCWAVSWHLTFNTLTWTNLNGSYGPDISLLTPNKALNASTTQIALPIGIDWMVGNHAINTKRLPFGAAFGVGFMPQFNMTSVASVSNPPTKDAFGCTPYIKVEGAMFLGWDVKVRALYSLGDMNLLDVHGPISGYTDGPFRVVSTGNLVLSFVLMPFSGSWSETHWWNTHDTYNKHDRFN